MSMTASETTAVRQFPFFANERYLVELFESEWIYLRNAD